MCQIDSGDHHRPVCVNLKCSTLEGTHELLSSPLPSNLSACDCRFDSIRMERLMAYREAPRDFARPWSNLKVQNQLLAVCCLYCGTADIQ